MGYGKHFPKERKVRSVPVTTALPTLYDLRYCEPSGAFQLMDRVVSKRGLFLSVAVSLSTYIAR